VAELLTSLVLTMNDCSFFKAQNNICNYNLFVLVCAEMKVMKVYIEFSLDQPKGGLHFVVPDVEGSMAERAAHVFSFGNQNSSR